MPFLLLFSLLGLKIDRWRLSSSIYWLIGILMAFLLGSVVDCVSHTLLAALAANQPGRQWALKMQVTNVHNFSHIFFFSPTLLTLSFIYCTSCGTI